MLKNISVVFLFFFSVLTMAQNTKAVFVDSVRVNADKYYGKDILGYDYYSKNNVLYKQKKSEKWEYKNLPLGSIHSLDLINPLKTLVFYKDFNTVVLLDNQLSEITKINLNDFGLIAQTCSMASSNRLWVYDNLNNQLMLLDYLNKKTTPVNQPFKNSFKHYSSDYNNWFRISEQNELYVYDNYGKATLLGNSPNFDKIFLTQNRNMFFSLNDNLYLYKGEKSEAELIFSSNKPFGNFYYSNGILTIFTENTLHNYTIKQP